MKRPQTTSAGGTDRALRVRAALQRATSLLREQHHAPALELLERLAAETPDDPRVLELHALCLRALGRHEDARPVLERLLELQPDLPLAWLHLAQVHQLGTRLPEARAAFARGVALDPSEVRLHQGLAHVCARGQDVEGCLAAARAGLEHHPDEASLLGLLAWALELLGEREAAIAAYRRSLEQDPRQTSSYYRLVQMGERPSVEELERVLELPDLDPNALASLHFSLGVVLDKAGEHDRAFAHFTAGNHALPAEYDPQQRTLTAAVTRRFFTPRVLEHLRGLGSDDARPILVVGMPRSGSSLVERVLSAHPDVAGMGERSELGLLVQDLRAWGGFEYPSGLMGLDRRTARRMARWYLERVAPPEDCARFVDKAPGNFVLLGVAAALFPNARVVHTRRHPLDTLVSCFTTNFSADRCQFSTRLEHMRNYYEGYLDMMEHWREVNPLPMLEVDYELLVQEGEPQMRRLVEFAGLDWDPRCASFHEAGTTCFTASTHQVSKKLYTGSLGRWKRFERHLEPLLDLVERWERVTGLPGGLGPDADADAA